MKKLTYIFLSLLVLAGCTTRQEYATMRHGLDSINERNRNDEAFSAADVQPYLDYFDRHGEPNDRLLAYYLLGRAYHEQGEAPMALKTYQQAIECADTLSKNCDFAQLCRVYAQMGNIFYSQFLFPQYRKQYEFSSKYALYGRDTLSALLGYEQQSVAYKEMGKPDSAIMVAERVSQLYKQHGYHEYSAIVLGSIANILINKGYYSKARTYMYIYEKESGLFDSKGNIDYGREIYYYFKGNLYLSEHHLDSAEYWYRKELSDGKDFNNQNGGALGLAKVYEQRHQPDSAAKYYKYAYAMNDSMYAQMATSEVERMQAMYDYTRHQEVARQKTIEANRSRQAIMVGSFVGLLVITLLLFALYRNRRKKQEDITLLQRQYEHDVDKLEQARYDLVRMQEEQLTRLMEEKEADIRELQRQVDAYGQQARPEDRLEGFLSETESYRRFRHFIMHPQEKATLDDWNLLHDMIDRKLPAFRTTLYSAQPGLKASDYDVCVLDRLYFTPSEIAMLTGKSLSSITMKRVRLLDKLFHVKGKGSQFDAFIRKIS